MHPYTRVNEKERLTRQLSGSIITETFVKKKIWQKGEDSYQLAGKYRAGENEGRKKMKFLFWPIVDYF